MSHIKAEALGSAGFRGDYGVRYAYMAGAMYKGIASVASVTALARAGILGIFGAGGVPLQQLEHVIWQIQNALGPTRSFGMNLLCNREAPELELATVDLYLRTGVRCVEAAAYTRITPALVRYRLNGLHRDTSGTIITPQKLIAKISNPEVAAMFMTRAPESIVRTLLERHQITAQEAELASCVALADDVCVECDSGGHTDGGVAYALLPAIQSLKEELLRSSGCTHAVRIGVAGGIGTPKAAAAAFVMDADFIVTGSINQCTVESGASNAMKELLAATDVCETTYVPAGDMFESGTKVQVARRGLLFPARANRLFEIYCRYGSIEEIDPQIRRQIEEDYFHRSFEEVWNETVAFFRRRDPKRITNIEDDPKRKMALIFRWYFVHSARLALAGSRDQRLDYQIHCGPAMGAFNRWVRGTELQPWHNRRVADLADRLMQGAASILDRRMKTLLELSSPEYS